MFIRETLFVQPIVDRHKMKELTHLKQVDCSKVYQVYDIWEDVKGPQYGIVGEEGIMVYAHYTNFLVCDSKTRKPLIKEVVNA